ncbi:uncharacterized protein KZ484_015871 isoform 1-T2 [Pholidichthys leucotaenia]
MLEVERIGRSGSGSLRDIGLDTVTVTVTVTGLETVDGVHLSGHDGHTGLSWRCVCVCVCWSASWIDSTSPAPSGSRSSAVKTKTDNSHR